MNAIQDPIAITAAAMQSVLDTQKSAVVQQGVVSAEIRIDRLDRSIAQLLNYQDKLVAALNSDFGHRSAQHSKLMDIAAAAKNLVPLTLELGGKSPVLIGRSADLELTGQRVMFGNTMNAGQICLAPDYCLVAEEQLEQLVNILQRSARTMFPTLLDNPDYSSIINERHYLRLQHYLEDARDKGATIIEINPAGDSFEQQPHYKLPPTLVLDPSDDMLIMQEEIFGPLLPLKTYRGYPEALAYVNAQPRPLGLYYFGNDAQEQRYTLDHTLSGGVTINDVIMHIAQEDLPFGGVGPNGMGAYHGRDGFKAFSHAKSIHSQTKKDVAGMTGMRPPFGARTEKTIVQMIKP